MTGDAIEAHGLLRRLSWKVRHVSDSVLGGEYRSAFRGRGREFDQVVKYEFGDDVRDIDWNVTARRGEPYRKRFIEEREVTLVVVFEDSVSLQHSSTERTKREALMELAGYLALMSASNRDRFGFVYVGHDGHDLREPVRGQKAIRQVASSLLMRPPPVPSSTGIPEIPWSEMMRVIPRHSVVIWLGDFPPRAKSEVWPAVQRRFQMIGFQVSDPWEKEMPHIGSMTAYDPVRGDLILLDTESSSHRKMHENWVASRDQAWNELFPNPFSRFQGLTSDSMLDVLVAFFRKRERAMR